MSEHNMFQVGDIIDGRWRLVSELSTDSGQGNTFLVADDQNADDEARYVIKLLRVDSPQTLARFGKEVRASFALQHSNIVRIKDSAFEGTSTPYLVTEYCSGGRLTAEKIRDLSTVQRLRIFEQICSAIAHAHRQGVIHRDIKPDNIFFESAESLIPVLGDFGLCFFTNDEERQRQTEIGESVGNWEFGPPWGHMGRQDSPNETFDVYNLGKLLYWFLSSGVRLYREYYDRPQYDLRKEGAEHLVYFAYEVMEKSINEDPSRLYLTAAEMRKDIQKLIVFVETEGRYLDCALVQACAFCRIGSYQWQFVPAIHFDNNDSRDKFNYRTAHFYGLTFDLDGRGTNVSTHPVLLIGKCGHCGNVQQFRLDKEFKDGAEWKNLPKPA